ncbi:CRISPR-associated nuclease/helicase Cas3 subtype I-F/YPEST [compost metagenome]
MRAALLDGGDKRDVIAAQWWRLPLTWNGELQRRTPFRHASPQESFFLTMDQDDDTPVFCLMQSDGVLKPSHLFREHSFLLAERVQAWFAVDYQAVLLDLAESKNMELHAVSRRYGEITLPVGKENATEQWRYHPILGVFRALN